jgi:SAM-dependent methyltransferase
MSGVSAPIAHAIAEKFSWDRYGSMVDIGCAQGCVPVTVARAHPHLACAGFDLPPVRPVFERYVAQHGLAQRVEFHAGDFFRDPLPAADVLVMGHILHDWDRATKRRLVAAAYQALPPGGALIVYDMMIDDERRENVMGLMMSLNMLIETSAGFDYTGADCRGWLSEAGFEQVRTEHLVGPHSMTVGVKPA